MDDKTDQWPANYREGHAYKEIRCPKNVSNQEDLIENLEDDSRENLSIYLQRKEKCGHAKK